MNLALYSTTNTFDIVAVSENFSAPGLLLTYNKNNNEINYENLIDLCIMVKNAGKLFEKVLTENLPIIDRWTVLDTGSTDNTIELINEFSEETGIRGEIYKSDFINFEIDDKNNITNPKLKNYVDEHIDYFRHMILNYNLFDRYNNLYKYVLRNTTITYLTRDLFNLISISDMNYDNLFVLTLLFAINKNDKELIDYL